MQSYSKGKYSKMRKIENSRCRQDYWLLRLKINVLNYFHYALLIRASSLKKIFKSIDFRVKWCVTQSICTFSDHRVGLCNVKAAAATSFDTEISTVKEKKWLVKMKQNVEKSFCWCDVTVCCYSTHFEPF